jgi:hypothetical protein
VVGGPRLRTMESKREQVMPSTRASATTGAHRVKANCRTRWWISGKTNSCLQVSQCQFVLAVSDGILTK